MTRPPVDVRQALPDDTEDLLVLWVQARAELGGAGRPLLGSSPDVIRPRLVDALTRRDDLHILLARWEGRPAGFAAYRVRDGVTVVTHSEVNRRFRGQGLGSELAKGTLDVLRAQGARVYPACPFFAKYVAEHPEYDDIIED